MRKFVETIDEDGDLIIINLEAITHVLKVRGQLQIHFQQDSTIAKLDGHKAEAFWKFLSENSCQVPLLQSREDKKIGASLAEAPGVNYFVRTPLWQQKHGTSKKDLP